MFDPASLAMGAVGAIGNAVSAGITNDRNQAAIDKQNTYNEKMWDKNNAYNTPLAQRKRDEEAGYNPWARQGQLQPVASTPTQSGVPKDSVNPNLGGPLGAAAMQAIQMRELTRVNDAEIAVKRSAADLNNAEAEHIRGYKNPNVSADTQVKLSAEHLNRVNAAYRDIESQLLNEFGSQKAVSDINLALSQALANMSSADLNAAKIDEVVQSIAESVARENNLKVTSLQIKQLTPLLVQGATLDNLRTEAQTSNIAQDTEVKKWEVPLKGSQINLNKASTRHTNVKTVTEGINAASNLINSGANAIKAVADLYPTSKAGTVIREILDNDGNPLGTTVQRTKESVERQLPKQVKKRMGRYK